jgi:hypothetical protein
VPSSPSNRRANHRAKRAKKNRAISEKKPCVREDLWYSFYIKGASSLAHDRETA